MSDATENAILAAPQQPRPNPTLSQRIWNLAASVAAFVADGCRTITKEQYQERLEICAPCPERRNNMCRQCGCQLLLKAQVRALVCPLAKWPALTEDNGRA
jgi:hypothetical protein